MYQIKITISNLIFTSKPIASSFNACSIEIPTTIFALTQAMFSKMHKYSENIKQFGYLRGFHF